MRCIQLGSSVGCSRVPQVNFVRKHFVRKQTMCKSLYMYLTIRFAFERPRWLLQNTADRAETVFSHLNMRLISISGTGYTNRKFPSYFLPLLQSESKFEAILMKMTLVCIKMKLHAQLISR